MAWGVAAGIATKAFPHIARGLATAGIGTLGSGVVTYGINKGKDALNDEADGTRAQQLAREEGITADGRLADWGFDNRWSAFFGGPSRKDVREAKIKQESDRIGEGYKPAIKNVNATLNDLGLSYDPGKYTFGTTNEDVYSQGIQRAEVKAGKLSQLAEMNGGALPAGLDMNSSIAAINSRISEIQKQKDHATSMEVGGSKWAAIENLKQTRIQNARLDHQFAEQARQLAADRELRREENKDKMQLSMLQYQGQREDRAYRREQDRRAQQQQSIMMLMKGLTQLGAGFAI